MPMHQTTPQRKSLVKTKYTNEVIALTIGANMLHWRKYKGISQQLLAQKAHMTQTAISDIENGDGNPTIETLSKIATALEIDIDLLTKQRLLWKMIEVIAYMTERIPDIDILKAMKLLYFTDLHSLATQGQKLTWLQYVRRHRWPFTQDVYQLNEVFTKQGEIYLPAHFTTYLHLTATDQKLLDHIINNYGTYTSTDLMELSYQSPPMHGFTKGDHKDMGKVVL